MGNFLENSNFVKNVLQASKKSYKNVHGEGITLTDNKIKDIMKVIKS